MPSPEDAESTLLNSIQNLQNLLTILVGLALAMAVSAILGDETATALHVKVLLGLGFLFTVTPFYHGALLHIFAAKSSASLRSLRFMLDYFMLLVESCLILLLGSVVARPDLFFWCVAVLLAFDSGWGFAFYRKEMGSAERMWAFINTGTVVALLVIFWRGHYSISGLAEWWGALLLTVMLLVRTIVDYTLCYRTYFPDRSAPSAD